MKLNRKNKLLIAGFIIMMVICYKFAFLNTITYYQLYNFKQLAAQNDLNDGEHFNKLSDKERMLDVALIQYIQKSETSFQNELLTYLGKLSEKYRLKILNFQEPHHHVNDNLKTSSYAFSLEGSFNEILLALNSIENDRSLGFVRHIRFIKNKNYKTNSDFLVCEVILQKNESISSN